MPVNRQLIQLIAIGMVAGGKLVKVPAGISNMRYRFALITPADGSAAFAGYTGYHHGKPGIGCPGP